jgi:hypothetical protein
MSHATCAPVHGNDAADRVPASEATARMLARLAAARVEIEQGGE